ncbi:nuclear transport factor 2 family protein [Kineobactrum salinum]|uniref:Nuclear transport factor 2 family protein n=1 Tax=Kineobactrum salinum TaxID=2708301 RepID=A0A6C0U4G6_9GAMM|nr:nuclear transport factor 2 family protein [Kineobactrum salinum]QIB65285.1 nuclear transport factor 2 family protein [Kineobactrum salinum]
MNEADANLALAERLVTALQNCDVAAVRELYTADARIWHNFDQAFQPLEDNLKSLQWMHHKLDNLRYDVVRREAIPGGFYQQHVLRGTLPSGEAFAMPACAIIKIEDGRIVALDEYLDSAHTEPLKSVR